MAVDITGDQKGYDGRTPARPLPAVGSFTNLIPFSVSGAAVGATSDAATIIFPQLNVIHGFMVEAFKIADGSKVDSDAMTVTVSGNTMTITETGAGTIETNIYRGLVWGDIKLA